jgi:hypothetical protein
MKLIILYIILVVVGGVPAIAQNKSIYTGTRTGACRTIKSDSSGAGSYEGECAGVGGYKVRLLEGDIRQTLNIITPAKKKFELDFWTFYSGFSSIGEKIEWRVKKGVPVALIARYNVAMNDDPRSSRSILMVSKIGKSSSCVTDTVEAGPKQNEKARELADVAATKPCMSTPN